MSEAMPFSATKVLRRSAWASAASRAVSCWQASRTGASRAPAAAPEAGAACTGGRIAATSRLICGQARDPLRIGQASNRRESPSQKVSLPTS